MFAMCLTLGSLVNAQDATPPPAVVTSSHETLQSTLWIQTSLEYAMSTQQVYRMAESKLDALVKDAWHTAAVEQTTSYRTKPPAIVIDVDETVLDNSSYQARTILSGDTFHPDTWSAWVNEENATAVPGAAAFLQYAFSRQVDVFFVTNRDVADKEPTRRNLERELSLAIHPDRLMCKGEKPDWTSDKSSRRRAVATTHRIVMLIGDDFNDFVTLTRGRPDDPKNRYVAPAERLRLGQTFLSRLGEHWFLLPNPNYGSWEAALSGGEPLDREATLKLKRKYLQPKYPPKQAPTPDRTTKPPAF